MKKEKKEKNLEWLWREAEEDTGSPVLPALSSSYTNQKRITYMNKKNNIPSMEK